MEMNRNGMEKKSVRHKEIIFFFHLYFRLNNKMLYIRCVYCQHLLAFTCFFNLFRVPVQQRMNRLKTIKYAFCMVKCQATV